MAAAGIAAATYLASIATRRRFPLGGKVFLITGGSRGLGLVLARQVCAAGASVVLLARDEEELERAKAELTRHGGNVLTARCDLTQPSDIEAAVRATVRHFGRLDAVINNAGIIEVGPLEHMTREDFERAMAVHFWAPYHVIMAALPHLRRREEARIVNIASIGGKVAVPHLAPYCASKFALVGLSDSLRSELARDRIFITTVAPGIMRTGSHVNANFKGKHGDEFAWFSAAAGLPLLSMSAERAAAKIIAACQRAQPFLAIPFSTKMAMAAAGVFPNGTAHALALANALLPSSTDSSGDQLQSGWKSRDGSRVPAWMTRSADRATSLNNEAPGTAG